MRSEHCDLCSLQFSAISGEKGQDTMFEITGAQIAELDDTDLRTLVARLAIAELHGQGCPSSSVTAGGNQDAADGGLDVRVECPSALTAPGFVPRSLS